MIQQPDYHSQEEFHNRVKKLEEFRSLGIDPYPPTFKPEKSANEILTLFKDQQVGDSEAAAAGQTPAFSIAGRLVLFRAMGKNIFAQIQDHSGRIQVMFNRDHTHLTGYDPAHQESSLSTVKLLEKKLDLGDFLGIEGHLFRTHVGELTLYVKHVTLLCKTLLPLPDKHSGLADKELRYRKRWLDLLSHPDICHTFYTRSRILRLIRNYFEQAEFIEVETPVLQNLYGGAEARPFTTTLNALSHQEMYLRISLEISLKKLIVGGINRLYEISKVFRNEGIDKTHNPEFTMVEAYAAYWDYNDMMRFVENLYQTLALELFGKTTIPYPHPKTGELIEVDVKAPWKRMSMIESIQHYAHIDVNSLSTEALCELLKKEGSIDPKKLATASRGALTAMLFEEKVEEFLIQPHHIIDHPIETTPLCKPHRDPVKRAQGLVERFESFILSSEICNAYSELNDPILQRELLEEQAKKREQGDEDASPLDEDFIEAICQGMPPTAGIGIGIDRLVMLFTQSTSIRDVLFFPLMKPQAASPTEL